MSSEILTQNRGKVGGFGFSSANVKEVGMGELPSMVFDEFCRHASATVIDSLQHVSQQQLSDIKRSVTQCGLFLLYQSNGSPIEDLTQIQDDEKYSVNPFWVDPQTNSINIGESYVGIKPESFAYYTLRLMGGGFYGWDGQVPPAALESYRSIRNAVNNYSKED